VFVQDLIGVPLPRALLIQDHLKNIALGLPQTQYATVLTGIAALSVLYILKRWKKTASYPGSFIVLLVFTLIFLTWGKLSQQRDPEGTPANLAGIALVGSVPTSLPVFAAPDFTNLDLGQVVLVALSIIFVGFMERYVDSHKLERDWRCCLFAPPLCSRSLQHQCRPYLLPQVQLRHRPRHGAESPRTD
jgi:MFS superfamily sulfate permease-like transporter